MRNKNITALEQILICEGLMKRYDSIEYHCETKRQFVARYMKISVQQASRIMGYFQCIPEIQELISTDALPISCTDQIAPKSKELQKQIYAMLSSAAAEGICLSRDRIVVPIASLLKEQPMLCWYEIRSYLNLVEDRKNVPKCNALNSDSTVAKGQRFVDAIVELMRQNGYADARSNTRRACDYMCDAMATDHYGRKMVFQMKSHYNGKKEGKAAVLEAATARLNYGSDIAVAVTNTKFSPLAQKLAAELNVRLWDGEYMLNNLSKNKG